MLLPSTSKPNRTFINSTSPSKHVAALPGVGTSTKLSTSRAPPNHFSLPVMPVQVPTESDPSSEFLVRLQRRRRRTFQLLQPAEALMTAAETNARATTSRGEAFFSGAVEQRAAAGLLDNASKNIQESGWGKASDTHPCDSVVLCSNRSNAGSCIGRVSFPFSPNASTRACSCRKVSPI